MAKKKLNRQEKAAKHAIHNQHPPQEQNLSEPRPDPPLPQPPKTHLPATMEDPSEKIESLKSLNKRLLEETSKNRTEINTLFESKKALQSKLTQSSAEIESLRSELARMEEESAKVEELRREVEALGKENQSVIERNDGLMREKGEVGQRLGELERQVALAVGEREGLEKVESGEIRSLERSVCGLEDDIRRLTDKLNRAVAEKDAIQRDFVSTVEEERRLAETLRALEADVIEKGDELRMLKSKYEKVEKDNEERKTEIESMTLETKSMYKCLAESTAQFEEMKNEAEQLRNAKIASEREKAELNETIGGLETNANKLNHTVSTLEKERDEQSAKLMDMERANAESLAKQEELKGELCFLVEGNREKDKSIDKLTKEKSHVVGRLDKILKELENTMEAKLLIVREKEEVEKAKNQIEIGNVELEKEVDSLKDALSVLQAKSRYQAEKNKQLLCELDSYKKSIEQANHEKNNTRKALEEEKMNGLKLKDNNSELQKKVVDAVKELEIAKAAQSNILGEKEQTEARYNKLVVENASVEKELSRLQKQIADMKAKVKSKSHSMDQALALLKSTAEQLTKATDKKGVERELKFEQNGNSEDLEPYLAELEVIKTAFMSRDAKVEEMKQMMESLQYSVTEARKKKSFWTLVSSATTVFAAIVSFAYASKLR